MTRWSSQLWVMDTVCSPLFPTIHKQSTTLASCEIGCVCKILGPIYIVFYNCRQTVKEDKAIIYEDWKENILPLLDSPLPFNLNPNFFGVEQYLAARSLIASRSFAIDEFHESGMVPLADL